MTMAAAMPGQPATLSVGRLAVRPLLCGSLWIEAERTLVVADLHLEKGSTYAGRGVFLPPYDSRVTLARLVATVATHAPRRIIALGDSFHDRFGADRLAPDDAAAIAALQHGREWLWILGNHDPDLPAHLGGDRAASVTIDGTRLVHEPTGHTPTGHTPTGQEAAPGASLMRPEIAGHLHPVAKVRLRGRSLRRRCFVEGDQRLILPAFGAYAGGLNVRDSAIASLFAEPPIVHMLGDSRLFAMQGRLLLPD